MLANIPRASTPTTPPRAGTTDGPSAPAATPRTERAPTSPAPPLSSNQRTSGAVAGGAVAGGAVAGDRFEALGSPAKASMAASTRSSGPSSGAASFTRGPTADGGTARPAGQRLGALAQFAFRDFAADAVDAPRSLRNPEAFRAAFDVVQGQTLEWDSADGCQARAYLSSSTLALAGHASYSIQLHKLDKPLVPELRLVPDRYDRNRNGDTEELIPPFTEPPRWRNHVAVAVAVDGEWAVLDPSLFPEPVSIGEWMRKAGWDGVGANQVVLRPGNKSLDGGVIAGEWNRNFKATDLDRADPGADAVPALATHDMRFVFDDFTMAMAQARVYEQTDKFVNEVGPRIVDLTRAGLVEGVAVEEIPARYRAMLRSMFPFNTPEVTTL